MKKEYKKGEKIRMFKPAGSESWKKYVSAISAKDLDLLKYACSKLWVRKANDAPRGGKSGDFFEVLRDFSLQELKSTMEAEVSALNDKLAHTLKTEIMDGFSTISNIGSFVIDSVAYSNFNRNKYSKVEICTCNASDFKTARYLSKREIYNAKEPISIVRFEASKTIMVANSDTYKHLGETKIDNVLGFAIWSGKLRVFVEKK